MNTSEVVKVVGCSQGFVHEVLRAKVYRPHVLAATKTGYNWGCIDAVVLSALYEFSRLAPRAKRSVAKVIVKEVLKYYSHPPEPYLFIYPEPSKKTAPVVLAIDLSSMVDKCRQGFA